MIERGEITIYDAMSKITEGKYAIPPFQREFQWSKEKIIKLWDSILMGYPISTFLFWRYTQDDESAKFLRFTRCAKFRASKTEAEAGVCARADRIEEGVLDGQQRLTSLFLSLCGQCTLLRRNQRGTDNGEPINIYINLSKTADQDADEDGFENINTYELIFSSKELRSPYFKLIDVMKDDFKEKESRTTAIDEVASNLAEEKRNFAKTVLNTLCEKIYDEPIIQYQTVNGEESEALEMFIRFNNGGKPLSKADISDATITYYWSDAPEKFKTVVKYKGNLDRVEARLQAYRDFGLNFIIRLGTILFEDNVAAPLGETVINGLRNNWTEIKDALAATSVFLNSLNIKIESYKSRWNVLLPVIYFVYRNPNYEGYEDDVLAYLSRSTLFKYYQSATTAKLTRLKKLMNDHQYQGFPVLETTLLDEISELRVTESKINDVLESKKGSPIAKIALEWLNYTINQNGGNHGDLGNLVLHEDHLQPSSLFDTIHTPFPEVPEDEWTNWKNYRDMLPNLQFFEDGANIRKSNHELIEYYENLSNDTKENYQNQYLLFHIADEMDKEILSLQKFGVFFEKRRLIIKEKLSGLLGLNRDETVD